MCGIIKIDMLVVFSIVVIALKDSIFLIALFKNQIVMR